ncbi:MAG: hypothetical protein RBS29_08170 [Bacteroidales bacterium]|jgi:hypothetical protein|nr:hypothetical protein [Bacteroidales bacterium]
MKRFPILLILLGTLFATCKKDDTFKYYSFDIFPVEEIGHTGTFIKTDFLSNEKLIFQISSLTVSGDYYDFEPIIFSSCKLYCNKDFMVNSDTIKPGENILTGINCNMISFKQQDKTKMYYNLLIRSFVNNQITIPTDYYQFNFEGVTKNGFEFKDSLIVKYRNTSR